MKINFILLYGALFLGACAVAPVSVNQSYDFSKIKRVAVLGFEPYPGQEASGRSLTGIFEKQLIMKGYHLVERAQIDKVLREQNFSMTGAVDSQQAVRLGKVLGVDALVLGNVTVYSPEQVSVRSVPIETEKQEPILTKRTLEYLRDGKKVTETMDVLAGYTTKRESRVEPQVFRVQAEAGVMVKMVDATTGEIAWVGTSTEVGTNVQVASEYVGQTIFNALKKDKALLSLKK